MMMAGLSRIGRFNPKFAVDAAAPAPLSAAPAAPAPQMAAPMGVPPVSQPYGLSRLLQAGGPQKSRDINTPLWVRNSAY